MNTTRPGVSRATWPFAVALTALAFVALHLAGLLGSLPLPQLFGILAGCVVANYLLLRRFSGVAKGFWIVAAVQAVLVTVVIYAIGWGPTLAIGYLFPLGEMLRTRGSKGWPVAFGASLLGMAGGQGAITLGWVHSYVPEPYVHGLAALAGLGLGFVMHLLASTAAAREKAEEEVSRSEKRFRSLVQNADDVVMVLSAEGRHVYDSPASERIFGYRPEDLLGRSWSNAVHPEDFLVLNGIVRAVTDGTGRTHRAEMRVRHADGSWRWCEVSSRNMLDDPAVGGYVVNVSDVTERHRRQEIAGQLAAIVESSGEAIVGVSLDGTVLSWNKAAERMYGYSAEEIVGSNALAETGGEHVLAMLQTIETGRSIEQVEVTRKRKDGTEFDISMTVSPVMDDTGDIAAISVIARDVTERKAFEARLHHLAFHDELTGVANRALLSDRIDQARARAKRNGTSLGLIVVDLDHFNQINQVFGPDTGDRVLKEVAGALGDLVRPTDTVARIGSDEFAVLVADLKDPAVITTALCDRVLERLAQPLVVEGNQISIEATVGAAIGADDSLDVAELIQRAEMALTRAKRSLLRREIADVSRSQSSAQKIAVVAELRRAIENGRLRLHYQPIIDLHEKQATAVEALVRWEDPDRGLVPPDDFVPLAENTGLIRPLTSFVLEQAINQLADWQRQLPDLAVSVNLSVTNLTDPDLPDEISQLLFEKKLPPKALTLEITESGVMSEPVRTAAVVDQLSGLGVRLSIDDFGTGYSSLAKLRSLPISEIKLDKSFVMNMARDPNDATIVRSSIELAHNLGLRVVAEGIETDGVASELDALGCDFGQGYWLRRPMPASAMTSWLCDVAGAAGGAGGANGVGRIASWPRSG